jgi:histone H3/H4
LKQKLYVNKIKFSPTCACSANNIAMEKKRKTLAAQDVLDVMKEMEFDKFIEPLKSSLESK